MWTKTYPNQKLISISPFFSAKPIFSFIREPVYSPKFGFAYKMNNKINILKCFRFMILKSVYWKLKNLIRYAYYHNPNNNTTQTQHCSWVGHQNDCANPTPPPPHKLNSSHHEPQINIYKAQQNIMWPVTTSGAPTRTLTTTKITTTTSIKTTTITTTTFHQLMTRFWPNFIGWFLGKKQHKKSSSTRTTIQKQHQQIYSVLTLKRKIL